MDVSSLDLDTLISTVGIGLCVLAGWIAYLSIKRNPIPDTLNLAGAVNTRVRYTPCGEVSINQLNDIRSNALYKHGDTVLIWANEGDLSFYGERYEPTSRNEATITFAAPNGWKLVPETPTIQMKNAGYEAWQKCRNAPGITESYQAMINTVENPPSLIRIR